MFIASFNSVFAACFQVFVLGFLGYICFKRRLVDDNGLNFISKLTIEVTLPLLIFTSILRNFSFSAFNLWWLLPLIGVAVSVCGFFVSLPFSPFFKAGQERRQYMALIGFQNAGYLMIMFISSYFSGADKENMLILLFLFLLGFNLLVWSFGVSFLTGRSLRSFELGSLFSPPVIAALSGLLAVLLGLNRYLPGPLIQPFKMLGDCTSPLALFMIGGNLARVRPKDLNPKLISLASLGKLVILPFIALILVVNLNLPRLLGLLILLEAAMPPAVSSSVILRHYKKEDIFVSQGIFFGHILSVLTVPLFLSLYFMLSVVK
ncbi:MAG: AEC family transporter [Candidatus Omnitrophica bacterium]|nr:AEC family transporter [Candidatus Omnitrophota bacterium]